MLTVRQQTAILRRSGASPITALRSIPKRGPLHIVNTVVGGPRRSYNVLDHDEVMRLRHEKIVKYREGWKSDVDMPNRWNVMSVLMMVAFGSPIIGLAFAWATYGVLWGLTPSSMLPPM